jgi:hypothetical protein
MTDDLIKELQDLIVDFRLRYKGRTYYGSHEELLRDEAKSDAYDDAADDLEYLIRRFKENN